ncbi:MAG: tail fiber domain-containing protein [Ferruginibacter sp.]
MNAKKYISFVMAVLSMQIAVTQTTPSIRIVSTNNTPALAIYGAGGAYKGYLWNKGAEDIELGTVGTTGSLHVSANGNEALTIQSDGRVRIGPRASLFNPDYGLPPFTVNGSLGLKSLTSPYDEWAITSNVIGNLVFYRNGAAKAYVDYSGDWIDLSDRSLKTGIAPFKSVLEGIKKLKVCSYLYKSDGARSFGLIAQEAAQYFPEIVSETTGKEGKKLLGIAYGKTGVLALKAIQEQQQVIETLQQEIQELKKLVTNLLNK